MDAYRPIPSVIQSRPHAILNLGLVLVDCELDRALKRLRPGISTRTPQRNGSAAIPRLAGAAHVLAAGFHGRLR